MRTFLAALAGLVLLPLPAHAACGAVTDPVGDTTVADGMVLDGDMDQPVASPALDLVRADLTVGRAMTRFAVKVSDLSSLATEAPTGAVFEVELVAHGVDVTAVADVGPAANEVELFAGNEVIGTFGAPEVDVGTSTVRFWVTNAALSDHGLRRGSLVQVVARTRRSVSVDGHGRVLRQGAGADHAAAGARPWGAC